METRIPFNISLRPEIEAGKYKVVTRDGRSVRIICWDAKQHESEKFSFPIIALVDRGKFGELSYNFTDNGRWDLHDDTALDLFLVPVEPELTWWEKKVKEEFDHYHKDPDDIKTCAAELIRAAIDYISKAAFTNVPALTNYYGLFNCRPKKELDVKQAMSDLDAKIKKATESWKGVDVDKYLDEVRGGETLRWSKGPYYIPSGGAMCLIRTKKDTPDNGYLYFVEYRMDIAEYEEFIPISELENLKTE